jgi:hypothetical protein
MGNSLLHETKANNLRQARIPKSSQRQLNFVKSPIRSSILFIMGQGLSLMKVEIGQNIPH